MNMEIEKTVLTKLIHLSPDPNSHSSHLNLRSNLPHMCIILLGAKGILRLLLFRHLGDVILMAAGVMPLELWILLPIRSASVSQSYLNRRDLNSPQASKRIPSPSSPPHTSPSNHSKCPDQHL